MSKMNRFPTAGAAAASVTASSGGIHPGKFSWATIGFFICLQLCLVLDVEGVHQHMKRFTGLYTGPYFDPTTNTNITTQLGTHAYLPCKIKQLGNKSVSWIRRRDSHILTVDRYTFIADERFQAFLVEATDTWTLQIKYVQARDGGQYECQVSTEPKMSHIIMLNVVVPKIEILGESDIYVKAGSTVQLKCVITQSLEEPAYIFWYHNGRRVLDYDRRIKDIRSERVGPDTTVGTLIVYEARREDSGNYTCSPSNLDSASVLLHVLNGEHPAAMQRGKNSASPIPGRWWGPLSAGLGFRSCVNTRTAVMAVIIVSAGLGFRSCVNTRTAVMAVIIVSVISHIALHFT